MGHHTPLFDQHQSLKARMVDFGGWDMPVQYPTGILAEHTTTRTAIGLFDTCHMGEFLLETPAIRTVLSNLFPTDFSAIAPGRAKYTFLLAEDGTIVDDAVVFLRSESSALICVNAGDIPGDEQWILDNLPIDCDFTNASAGIGKIDIQGPRAHELIKHVTGHEFRTQPFFSFIETDWQGHEVILSRSGYTGEPGVEIFIETSGVQSLWAQLLEAGEPLGALPCGLGARDTLRLEAGLPLYGHELSRTITPLHAGFSRFLALDGPGAFPGKAALRALTPQTRLVGLRLHDQRTPRQGFTILHQETPVGEITSGAPSPTLNHPIAMGYLPANLAESAGNLTVQIRKSAVAAEIVSLPFYQNPDLRKRATEV